MVVSNWSHPLYNVDKITRIMYSTKLVIFVYLLVSKDKFNDCVTIELNSKSLVSYIDQYCITMSTHGSPKTCYFISSTRKPSFQLISLSLVHTT